MAPSDAYSSAGSGKLKLKGVKDSKVDKKKKKKSSSSKQKDAADVVEGEGDFKDRSVMLKKLEEEDEVMAKEEGRSVEKRRAENGDEDADQPDRRDGEAEEPVKTEAERRYDEQRRRRLEERLKREGVKTHKERVEELNRYLSGLSEHHDMPRIGPG